ncbi:glucan endo-1,3-beta-glucosidase, basic isoform-like [Andrographis paniculata]|uniref:glucan endo-1,3-beta-glucosidase, basic isoform-like n=1 Tax=Andrographis paniculata TaxID=175694 RepID=UPI0021E81D22|nr:glucan endo-1,3-beta-glucosidase, basic isoform-like [Andrographis paniculata]
MGQSFFEDNHNATIVRVLLVFLVSIFLLHSTDAGIGANYGTIADNLPPPPEVLSLCQEHNITSIRIFDPNPSILEALSKGYRKISVLIGVVNQDIPAIANDPNTAKSWVQTNILRYKKLNVKYIAVGNEITPSDAAIAPSVAPAMQNIQAAVTAAGLSKKIKVSTALSTAVLGNSYPPSAGQFKPEFVPSFITPIVKFLTLTRAPLLVNVYPYFAYISDPVNIKLDYALFTSSTAVVVDGEYRYYNLFTAIVDAFYAALEKVDGGDLRLVVSETGWPSDGGIATSVENAKTYNQNLVKFVKKGTPRRAGKGIETYIFDLIDENQKSPELEKHWGLFLSNKQPKYPITIDGI